MHGDVLDAEAVVEAGANTSLIFVPARFAPDGQTIIYSAAWEGRPMEVFIHRVESPESRPFGLAGAEVLASTCDRPATTFSLPSFSLIVFIAIRSFQSQMRLTFSTPHSRSGDPDLLASIRSNWISDYDLRVR